MRKGTPRLIASALGLLGAANASSSAKTLRLAGYDWEAKSGTHEGPGPNSAQAGAGTGRRTIICDTVDSLASGMIRAPSRDAENRRFSRSGGKLSDQQQRATVSFQELVLSNMLTLNALVELLDERGILAKTEVLDRVKRLHAEMSAKQKLQLAPGTKADHYAVLVGEPKPDAPSGDRGWLPLVP